MSDARRRGWAEIARRIAFSEGARRVAAFDWISGRVGSRENPDGMRSLMHAIVFLALACGVLDAALLWRHAWTRWELFSFLHLAWISAFLVGTVSNVGFLETLDGIQLHRLGGPNVLTLTRGLLIPPLIYLIATADFVLAALLYGLVTGTDVVDGWWARRFGGQSKLGIVLDPVVDLLVHVSVFTALGLSGALGLLGLILILVRTALLVLGTIVLYLWKGRVRIQPTPLGKGTGLLLTLVTLPFLWLLGCEAPRCAFWVAGLRHFLTALLALAALHVVAIGIVNLGRPAVAAARPRPLHRRMIGRPRGRHDDTR